ncbi:hypothetical protein ABT294_12240 [Nonomuraea sp. NPDC000554]|uniref:hypothetical protein n=1 Tax=Nonomuraea sp. NPDC000554 TaxID=3154259 RepID=UPI00333254E2
MAMLRQVKADLLARRNVEAYVVALVVICFAVVSIINDIVPDQLKWSALFAAVGLLVYRLTLPEQRRTSPGDLLRDRSAFDTLPATVLFANARDVRVFAPSAVNLLSPETCETLRTRVLRHKGGSVRIVTLDPEEPEAIRLASRQLDESVEHQLQSLPAALAITLERLAHIATWEMPGELNYRLFPYNPGFSLVLIDPETAHGRAIVEIHGFHNTSTFARMHLNLTREQNDRWYAYWVQQFDHLWDAARPSDKTQPTSH